MYRTRPFRRHNFFKLRKRAKLIADTQQPFQSENHKTEWIVRNSDNLACCSCTDCGNPRKHFNKQSLQEIKNIITFKEQLYEDQLDDL